ncbi:Uncharacterized protein HZ326_7611 [Fusarium oxysporum f. sp. albedinis]|nr:Uncharacterized protein HZ326_7611 [Fusarium oxysporum f. sp. albedinis]
MWGRSRHHILTFEIRILELGSQGQKFSCSLRFAQHNINHPHIRTSSFHDRLELFYNFHCFKGTLSEMMQKTELLVSRAESKRVVPPGIEPGTFSVLTRCHNQLDHGTGL